MLFKYIANVSTETEISSSDSLSGCDVKTSSFGRSSIEEFVMLLKFAPHRSSCKVERSNWPSVIGPVPTLEDGKHLIAASGKPGKQIYNKIKSNLALNFIKN